MEHQPDQLWETHPKLHKESQLYRVIQLALDDSDRLI